MPDAHARLSPSSSARWLSCPPSLLLSESFDDETTIYAEEGTEAHLLCEWKVRRLLGEPMADPRPGMRHLDGEMEQCSDSYAAYAAEALEEAGEGALALVETRVDLSRWAPGCFGTCDLLIASEGLLHVIDFKYGKGVAVAAEGNTQLMCYALGALDLTGFLFSPGKARLSIFQPRLSSLSEWETGTEALLRWGGETLAPGARKALAGEGEYKAGPWCRFCKAKAGCRARAEESLRLAAYDFREPALLTADELPEVLKAASELESWVSDVRGYALGEILRGREVKGWKAVEGRSSRKWKDEGAVAAAVEAAGYDPYERSLKGITAMTSMLGRKRFGELLGSLTEKAKGRPALAPEGDRRPALATDDFA